MGRGLFSGPKMKSDRQKFRWKDRGYKKREEKRRQGGVLKHDPLKGSTQAKGIVVEKVGIEAKQPNCGSNEWRSPVYCPPGKVAVGLLVHTNNGSVTGLGLRCKPVEW